MATHTCIEEKTPAVSFLCLPFYFLFSLSFLFFWKSISFEERNDARKVEWPSCAKSNIITERAFKGLGNTSDSRFSQDELKVCAYRPMIVCVDIVMRCGCFSDSCTGCWYVYFCDFFCFCSSGWAKGRSNGIFQCLSNFFVRVWKQYIQR